MATVMPTEFDDILDRYGKAPKSEFAAIVDEHAKPSYGKMALDVAKQIPSGLVAGTEAVAAFPAQAAGFVGGLAEKYIPGMAPSPEQAADRAKLLELTAGARKGVAQYLPEPTTTAGKVARTASEFVPAAVAGSTYSVPRALAVGAGTGALSEGAGQLTEGTPLEAPARVVTSLAGGHVGGRLAERGATTAALEAGKTAARTGADTGYKAFREADFNIHPDLGTNYARTVRTDLENTGRNEITAPQTLKALDRIEAKPFATPQEIQRDYQMLGHVVADNTAKASDRFAARIAQERLLTEVETKGAQHLMPTGTAYATPGGSVAFARMVPEEAVQTFQKANQDWAALKRAENLDQRITKGELRAASNYSGLNLENELRRRVSVLADKDVGRGFSEAERAAFDKYGRGNIVSNAPRYIKNLIGGGGGLGALGAGGAAFGLGRYFDFDPATAAGASVIGGLGLAKYGNMRALNRARELELQLLRRSPSAQQAGIPGTRSNVPFSVLAPTLSTLGD